jgi:hypothetical protein
MYLVLNDTLWCGPTYCQYENCTDQVEGRMGEEELDLPTLRKEQLNSQVH